MNYYGARDLAAAFRTVRKNTIQIARDVPEERYGFRAAEGTFTVAETLTHIALAVGFHYALTLTGRTSVEGFNFPELMARAQEEMAKPRTKAELLALLETEGEKFASTIEGLSEDFLGGSIALPPGAQPPSKTRFEMLMGTKEHEMHHRAQLMLIERMLGITPHLTRDREAMMAAMQAAATAAKAGS